MFPPLTNRKKTIFGLTGGALLLAGILLIAVQPYRAKTVIASASGCNMRVDIVEPISGEPQGYVVLFHGLSANKRVMFFLAEGFANQNLRVFLPDFPGHGRTPGPFTPARAESCAASLVSELIDRRAIVPQRTILAGHSMGGAIAMRIASRFQVAGIIAVSPAPQHSGHGVGEDMLPFRGSVPPPKRTLAIRGAWEPSSVRALDRDYLESALDSTSEYRLIPSATHVSLLFDSDVARADREWIARVLDTSPEAMTPSRAAVFGVIVGLAGLCVLVVPFLIETVSRPILSSPVFVPLPVGTPPLRALLQVLAASVIAAALLRLGVPLKFLRIFEGDYLASFFLLGGILLLSINWRIALVSFTLSSRTILTASFAAIALILLFGGWFDLTFFEAFLTLPRWPRLPAVALAVLPWHFAEEILLAPIGAIGRAYRAALGLAFRVIPWLAMTAALLYFHSGEILIALLAAYFLIFFVLQRMAVDVVHRETRSALAAAVFGAILFAGLALAIFPVA
jgi:pimeloyl-ACP methyl ester carboxylesterase